MDGRICDHCSTYDPITEKILIVKLGAVGDVLRTTSILPKIKEAHPTAEITWLTKANAWDLLRCNPLVDRVLTVEENPLSFLLSEHFNLGICLDADQLSTSLASVTTCDRRLGFVVNAAGKIQPVSEQSQEWWLMGLNDTRKRTNRHSYQERIYEICDLSLPICHPQLYLDESSEKFGRVFYKNHDLERFESVLGINTGGSKRWPLKKWTLEGYLECIHMLRTNYPKVGLLLLGGPEEVPINKAILENVGNEIIDAGCHHSLLNFAAVIRCTNVLLSSDSLAMHMGIAFKIPTIVLVGPTSPWELEMYDRGKVLYSDLDCIACYRSQCSKIKNCMNSLSPRKVVRALAEYLPSPTSPMLQSIAV